MLQTPQQWAPRQRQALQAWLPLHYFQLPHPPGPKAAHARFPLVGQPQGLQLPLGVPTPQQRQLLQVQAAALQGSVPGRRWLWHLPALLRLQRRSLLAVGSAPAALPAGPPPRLQMPAGHRHL